MFSSFSYFLTPMGCFSLFLVECFWVAASFLELSCLLDHSCCVSFVIFEFVLPDLLG